MTKRSDVVEMLQEFIGNRAPMVLDAIEQRGWRIHRKREQHVNPRRKVSVDMTADLGAKVRKLHATVPSLTLEQIGQVYNINSGRVSEALAGKW